MKVSPTAAALGCFCLLLLDACSSAPTSTSQSSRPSAHASAAPVAPDPTRYPGPAEVDTSSIVISGQLTGRLTNIDVTCGLEQVVDNNNAGIPRPPVFESKRILADGLLNGRHVLLSVVDPTGPPGWEGRYHVDLSQGLLDPGAPQLEWGGDQGILSYAWHAGTTVSTSVPAAPSSVQYGRRDSRGDELVAAHLLCPAPLPIARSRITFGGPLNGTLTNIVTACGLTDAKGDAYVSARGTLGGRSISVDLFDPNSPGLNPATVGTRDEDSYGRVSTGSTLWTGWPYTDGSFDWSTGALFTQSPSSSAVAYLHPAGTGPGTPTSSTLKVAGGIVCGS